MEYSFSWFSFFIGIIILIVGMCITIWHKQLADMFGSGLSSYGRYRLWGLAACGLGVIVMINLHTVLLTAFFSLLFGSR